MPLREGSSDEVISENIAELMRSGKYEHKQAIAIAYSKAGRSHRDLAKALIEEPDAAIMAARQQLETDTANSNNAIMFAVVREINAAGNGGNSQGRTDPAPTTAEKVSGEYAKRTVGWQGLTISIENEAGSHREGVNRNGQKWRQHMPYAYGYLNQTTGVDGDAVDVFMGPNMDSADYVYIVHARKVNRWDEYDEDKVMLGFDTEQEAKDAFLASYSDPRFLGPVTRMLVGEFVDKAMNTLGRPTIIKALILKATGTDGVPVTVKKKSEYTFPVRKLIVRKRGADGLIPEPDAPITAEDEKMYGHVRMAAANEANYADQKMEGGRIRTWDPEGNYPCGRCNKAIVVEGQKPRCAKVNVFPKYPNGINLETGSCRFWENVDAGDPECDNDIYTVDDAGYAENPSGKGWGCLRCWARKNAVHPDSQNRADWCGEHGMPVMWNACCNKNRPTSGLMS